MLGTYFSIFLGHHGAAVLLGQFFTTPLIAVYVSISFEVRSVLYCLIMQLLYLLLGLCHVLHCLISYVLLGHLCNFIYLVSYVYYSVSCVLHYLQLVSNALVLYHSVIYVQH